MTGTQPLRALLAEATTLPVFDDDFDKPAWATYYRAQERLETLAPDMARLLLDMGDALTATAQVGCQPGTRFQDYTRTCGICDTCVARSLVARLSALGDGTADR